MKEKVMTFISVATSPSDEQINREMAENNYSIKSIQNVVVERACDREFISFTTVVFVENEEKGEM